MKNKKNKAEGDQNGRLRAAMMGNAWFLDSLGPVPSVPIALGLILVARVVVNALLRGTPADPPPAPSSSDQGASRMFAHSLGPVCSLSPAAAPLMSVNSCPAARSDWTAADFQGPN